MSAASGWPPTVSSQTTSTTSRPAPALRRWHAATETGRRGSLTREPRCVASARLAPGGVDQPARAEAVDEHAEGVAPGRLLERHHDRPSLAQTLPVAAQGALVVAAERDRHAGLAPVLHRVRRIRRHDGEAVRRLELRVHDLVLLGGILARVEVAERRHGEVAAEDRLVEGHRLAGGVAEVQVRVQPNGHFHSSRRSTSVASLRPGASQRTAGTAPVQPYAARSCAAVRAARRPAPRSQSPPPANPPRASSRPYGPPSPGDARSARVRG